MNSSVINFVFETRFFQTHMRNQITREIFITTKLHPEKVKKARDRVKAGHRLITIVHPPLSLPLHLMGHS